MFGVSFLTPLAALFGLAVAIPLGALLLTERRARHVRAVLRVRAPGRRALLPIAIALVLLPLLVAVAAAQPIVVREQRVPERADAQAFVVFDTSRSMQAAGGRYDATRLRRAKRLALRLERAFPDIPFGVATMTDRTLPNLMPTVDQTTFARTVDQTVAIDSPPPSQPHRGRATTFDALVPLVQANVYAHTARRRLLVVLSDGEGPPPSPLLHLELQGKVTSFFVHVWQPDEHIYKRNGHPDPNYAADPASGSELATVASVAGGRMLGERDFGALTHAVRDAAGRPRTRMSVSAYTRVPLAPWFVLAAAVPLAFVLWRRNL